MTSHCGATTPQALLLVLMLMLVLLTATRIKSLSLGPGRVHFTVIACDLSGRTETQTVA
jgi:hypothetical protein